MGAAAAPPVLLPVVLALLLFVWPCLMISVPDLDFSVDLCPTCDPPIKAVSCEIQEPRILASLSTNGCIKLQKPVRNETFKCTVEFLVAKVPLKFPVVRATTKVTLFYEMDVKGKYAQIASNDKRIPSVDKFKVGIAEEFCPPTPSTTRIDGRVRSTSGGKNLKVKAGKVEGEILGNDIGETLDKLKGTLHNFGGRVVSHLPHP